MWQKGPFCWTVKRWASRSQSRSTRWRRLRIAGGFALAPQAAGARVVDAALLVERARRTIEVRVGETQRDAVLVGDDRGPQAVGAVGVHAGADGVGETEAAGVEGHADLGVDSFAVERGDLRDVRHAAGDRQTRVPGVLLQLHGAFDAEAAHGSFGLDEGDEEAADEVAQLFHAFGDAGAGGLAPAVRHYFAVVRIQRGDDALARELAEDLGASRGAEDDLVSAGIQPAPGCVDVADAAADAAAGEREEIGHDGAVAPLAEGRVEVDDGDLADDAEALGDGARVAGVEFLFAALHELHRGAAHEIDRRDDHVRTSSPRAARACLTSETVYLASWKIEAARTASAPASSAAAISAGDAAPPEATIGMFTAARMAPIRSRS